MKQAYYLYDTFVVVCEHRSVMQLCKIHPYVAAQLFTMQQFKRLKNDKLLYYCEYFVLKSYYKSPNILPFSFYFKQFLQ